MTGDPLADPRLVRIVVEPSTTRFLLLAWRARKDASQRPDPRVVAYCALAAPGPIWRRYLIGQRSKPRSPHPIVGAATMWHILHSYGDATAFGNWFRKRRQVILLRRVFQGLYPSDHTLPPGRWAWCEVEARWEFLVSAGVRFRLP